MQMNISLFESKVFGAKCLQLRDDRTLQDFFQLEPRSNCASSNCASSAAVFLVSALTLWF